MTPRTPLALAMVGSLSLAGSAFAMNDLPAGYMVAAGAVAAAAPGDEAKKAEGSCGAAAMDADKDGKVSKAEYAAAHPGGEGQFAAHDGNGDGFIDAAEMSAHGKAGGDKAKTEGKCGEGKCGEGKCGGGA